MAVPIPTSVTTANLTGTYTLNAKLSDSSQSVLKMQNISWVVRQAVAYSTVTITLKQYTNDKGVVKLDQDQVSTGGTRNREERVLDGEWRESENKIWGKVKGRTRWVKLADVEDDYLKQGWDSTDGDFIESLVESATDTWTALQLYGFAEVEGARRHVRKVVAKKGNTVERIRLIYDWKG
ncbi:hypothetical protein LTR08_005327 [Meristemomyces frigidus]|nr:hypothetical protein LTR08_005327 [Meristemomyces frigidus]